MQTEKSLTEQEALAIFGVDDEDLSVEVDTPPTERDETGDTPTVAPQKSSKKSKSAQEVREESKKEMIAKAKIQKVIDNVHEARDRERLAYQEETKVLHDRLEADRQALIRQLAESKTVNEQFNRQVDLLSASIPKQSSRAQVLDAAPNNSSTDTVTQPVSAEPVDMTVQTSDDDESYDSDSREHRLRRQELEQQAWAAAAEREEARPLKRHAKQQRKHLTKAQRKHPSFKNSSKGDGGDDDGSSSENSTDANKANKHNNEPIKKRPRKTHKKNRKGKSGKEQSSSSSSSSNSSSSSSSSSDSSSQSDSSTEGRHRRKNKRSKSSRKFNFELAASGNTELPKCPEAEPIGHTRLTSMKNQLDQIAVSSKLSRRKIKSCFSLIQRD